MTSAAPFRIGLLGHGTVGSALESLVVERADAVEASTGRRPEVSGVLTRSRGDFREILAGSDLIVELIGGLEPARSYILEAIAAGRHVVTANKQVLAEHGEEIYEATRAAGVQLRFEAAVGGVVPVIRVIHETLAGAHIERVHGIVNGTTNFVLSEMARTGESYEAALAGAQRLGYAEADPTDDVSGRDAAAKMAIIARLAFGVPLTVDQVPYEGIDRITSEDIAYARELGLSLKLVGSAERIDGGVAVRVYPAFLYGAHPLAAVSGSFNAVTIESPAITEITLSGPGAGGSQTASAVLGDIVSAMIPPPTLPPPPAVEAIVTDLESAFYLHLQVADRPGVLARIADVLGRHHVSVRSVVQRGLGEDARLEMVVHPVRESRFYAAVEEIAALELMRAAPRVIRVIDEVFEGAGSP